MCIMYNLCSTYWDMPHHTFPNVDSMITQLFIHYVHASPQNYEVSCLPSYYNDGFHYFFKHHANKFWKYV